jgi:hypothetical protein
VVSIQRLHDADPREHRRAARRRDQDQRLHCRLPLRGLMLGLRKLRDVAAGMLEGDEPKRRYFLGRPVPLPRPLMASSSSRVPA